MKTKLILEAVATPEGLAGRSNHRSQPDGEQPYRVNFQDPIELLRLMTAERIEIVILLLQCGPLPANQIAARTLRPAEALGEDLQKLLEADFLKLGANDEYYFDHQGIQLNVEWPPTTVNPDENLTTDPPSHIRGLATEESSPLSQVHRPNAAVGYPRSVIHVLMGITLLLIIIEVILYLGER